MANMSPMRNPMPSQDPLKRCENFDEVALGYTKEQAVEEADRCLNCKTKPCVKGCPVGIDIPEFIMLVKQENFSGAYDVISEASSLPAICGRVCPQERQCEKYCVRANKGESVGIGRLERFVADYRLEENRKSVVQEDKKLVKTDKKVAIVGSGPAGLACAGALAKKGHSVTVFEALHTPGGVLVYGIPEFRLPKQIVAEEIDTLRNLGVEIETNMVIGKILSVDELFERGFNAVFIGTGAGLPRFMNIKGENLKNVYSANEFLTRINLMKAYKEESNTPIYRGNKVAVVGGGNVAMDAARSAKRLGAKEVYIIYRRSGEEIPARREEVEHAEEEGIIFKFLTNPIEILPDENNTAGAVRCIKMELGEPDSSGRRSPAEVPGSEFEIEADCVIIAIGTSPNPLIKNTTEGLETDRKGCIITKDENGLTSRKNVYAGGDAVTGAATVILAMGAGKSAAEEIDKGLRSN